MRQRLIVVFPFVLACADALAAGSVVLDNTLPGHPANTLIPLASGTYTIPASQGYVSGPSGATHNLFFSFLTFNIDSGETGLFTNDLAATYPSSSFGNLVSRVTGGTPSTINGTVDSTAFPNANFWFVNPAGVTLGSGAVLNVPAGLAIGAADYVSFANGARWYVIDGNAPSGFPSTLSTSSPAAFGFLPTPATGAVTFQGTTGQGTSLALNGPLTLSAGPGGVSLNYASLQTTNSTPGGGSAAGPDITINSNGGTVALQSSNLTTRNLLEANASSTMAAAGNINISGQTIVIHGGSIYSQTLNGADAGSITLAASGSGSAAIQIDGGAALTSDATEGNSSVVNNTTVSIANAGTISLQAPAGGISINSSSLRSQAGDFNPSGAGTHAGQAGAVSLNAAQISLSGASITTSAMPANTTGVQQDAQGVVHVSSLEPAPITVQASGAVSITNTTNVVATTAGALAAGDVDIGGASITISGSSVTASDTYCGCSTVPSTGNSGNIAIASPGTISIQKSTLAGTTQTAGNGGSITIAGTGQQGAVSPVLIEGTQIRTGSTNAPGVIRGNAGSATISGPSVLLSGSSIDTSTVGTGIAGNISITAAGSSGVGPDQGGTGDALLLTGGTTVAATSPSLSLTVGAPPGSIAIEAPVGSLRIDSGSTVTSSAAHYQGGPITLLGGTALTLADASLYSTSDALLSGGGGGNPPIDVSLQSSGPILLTQGTNISSVTGGNAPGGNIVVQTSGAVTVSGQTALTSITSGPNGPAGNISVTGAAVHVTGSTVNASTSRGGTAGNITLEATGTDPAAGTAALLVDGGAVISSDATIGAFLTTAAAGNVLLSADRGTASVLGVPGASGPTTTISSSTVSGSGGPAGTVTISGVNVLLDEATVETTLAAHLSAATPPTISVNASGNVSLIDSVLDAHTHGSVAAGDVSVSGSSVMINGGQLTASTAETGTAGSISVTATGPDPSAGTPALLVYGAASLSSDATAGLGPGANAGNVKLSAPSGTVQVGLATDAAPTLLSTAAGSSAGSPGIVSVQGATVDLGNAQISTIADSSLAGTTRGSIVLNAAQGAGALTVANSSLDATTNGVQQAGEIDLAGGSIHVNNSSVSSRTSSKAAAGAICVGNLACSAGAAAGGSSATGAIVIDASSLSTSTSSSGTAGDIQLSAASVSINGGSIAARTTGTGNAGSIEIDATAADAGGAAALLIAGGAQVSSDATGGQSMATNAGSVTLSAVNGTAQVGSPTDVATAPTTVSTSAGSAAGRVGYLVIQGRAVTVEQARLAATTASSVDPLPNQPAIQLLATGAPVSISGADLSAATSSAATASGISISGPAVSVTGGSMTAKTTGTGSAGSIALTATGSDPQGGAALSITGGATISSDAAGGLSPTSNAGAVRLSAANGTIGVGLAGDTTSTTISTSAGPNAGAPGAIAMSGAAIDLGDASVTTLAQGQATTATRGTILLEASGPLSIANSTLGAATSGVQQAGEIDLQGASVNITGTKISSETTGAGAAGAICVSGGNGCMSATMATAGGTVRSRQSVQLAAAAPASGGVTITGSSLNTSTNTFAPAGDINLTAADALDISASTVASQSTSTAANAGPVGAITLAGSPINILNGSQILATSLGGTSNGLAAGTGAAITINEAPGTAALLISGSTVSTAAATVNGSNILVNAGGSPIELVGSQLSASAGVGNGGNITINDAGNTVLAQSAILAQAGPGNGGAINIALKNGAVFVQDSASIVSATSDTGNNGTVTINSPRTDLNSALRVPDVSAARAPELAANACRRDAAHSTFVREGQGGVSPRPDGYLNGRTIPAKSAAGARSASRDTEHQRVGVQPAAAATGC